MYESVHAVFLVRDVSGYAVCVCLKHGHAALAVTASVASLLARRLRRLRVRLLRLHDDLPYAIALLVRATTLHLRHRRLHFSEPRVRHFCLTARNKTTLTRSRTEIPLTSICMNVVHDLEPREGLIGCDDCDMRICEGSQLFGFTWVGCLLVR